MLRILFFFATFFPLAVFAQRTIKWQGMQLNALDKEGRKQGEWLFFDKRGNALMTCRFENDKIAGPKVFFNNGDTVLLRLEASNGREPFVYYYNGQQINGAFVQTGDQFKIELDHIPSGFSEADLADLKRWYAVKIDPVFMFGTQRLADYFSAAYYKSNAIPNWHHNFVLTINASGKVTNVEWEKKEERWTENLEREVFDMFYSMGRWQPFFDTWQTKEIKVTMSLGADLNAITAR